MDRNPRDDHEPVDNQNNAETSNEHADENPGGEVREILIVLAPENDQSGNENPAPAPAPRAASQRDQITFVDPPLIDKLTNYLAPPPIDDTVFHEYRVCLEKHEFLVMTRPSMNLGNAMELWQIYLDNPYVERVTIDGDTFLALPLHTNPLTDYVELVQR